MDSIKFDSMQLDWKTAFPIQNFELNIVFTIVFVCAEKANIIFRLKGVKICFNSYKWIKMHLELESIHFNIRE